MSPVEGDDEDYFDYLNPKSEARSTKQISMTKIPMTETKSRQILCN